MEPKMGQKLLLYGTQNYSYLKTSQPNRRGYFSICLLLHNKCLKPQDEIPVHQTTYPSHCYEHLDVHSTLCHYTQIREDKDIHFCSNTDVQSVYLILGDWNRVFYLTFLIRYIETNPGNLVVFPIHIHRPRPQSSHLILVKTVNMYCPCLTLVFRGKL